VLVGKVDCDYFQQCTLISKALSFQRYEVGIYSQGSWPWLSSGQSAAHSPVYAYVLGVTFSGGICHELELDSL